MAAITWTDVTNHVAGLSTIVAGAQTDILAFVNTALVADEFGGEAHARLKLARIYLAAHFATINGAGGGGGPLTSQKLGDESRNYGSFSMSSSALSTTGFGITYLSLVNSSAARAPFVIP